MKENNRLISENYHCPEPSALFNICYDDSIILKDANEEYLRLHGLDKNSCGKDINILLGSDEAALIHSLAERYRGEDFAYRYIRSFRGSEMPYKIRLSLSYPDIIYSGRKIQEKCSEISEGCDTAISFIRTENGFEADMLGELSDKTRKLILSDNICCHNGMKSLLNECLSENKSCSRIENFSDDDTPGFVRLTAIPVSSTAGREVIVTISSISAAENDTQMCMLSGEIIGTALISCSDREHMYFEDISPLMAELMLRREITGKQLMTSYPFESAMSQGSISVGRIGSGKENGGFLCAAVPVLRNGAAVRMLTAVIPVENDDMMDRSLLYSLTTREYNVMSLAARGLNTRDIGKALNTAEGTVKKQLFSCYKKLNVNNRVEMMRKLYHL